MRNFLFTCFLVIGCVLMSDSSFAQAPVISYPASPYTFGVGNNISPAVTPTNSGGTVTSGTGGYSTVTLLQTLALNTHPVGITTDAAGNSYVVATKANGTGIRNIFRVTSAGVLTTVNLPTNPFNTPTGIVLDGAGALWVADQGAGKIFKFTINVATNTATLTNTIGTNAIGNIFSPIGLTFDGTNNIYVADAQGGGAAAGVIFKINATTFAVTSFATGFNNPYGVALDISSGSIFIANTSANTVIKITSGGVRSTVTGTFNQPAGLSPDGLGNIYVADAGSNTIKEISAAGVVSTMIATGLASPRQVSFDGANPKVLYEADFTNDIINKSNRTTFYTISATLPSGVNFDPLTGIISGTPTATSPATNYTITGYNSAGSSSTTISVTCIKVPSLSYASTSYNLLNGAATTTIPIINAVGAGAVTSSYTLNIISGALPTGVTFNPANGTFTCTPTATGTITFTVTGSNAGGGSTTASTTITVNNPPVPVISYPTPQTYTAGIAITALNPTNTGGAAVSYAVSGIPLPAGLTLNPGTGQITGTPSAASAATDYGITATNTGGTSAVFNINITVNNPLPPTFSYSTPPNFVYGTAITPLTPVNTGGPVQATGGYSVSPTLPAGLTLDVNTGIISGTPTAVATTAGYTVTAVGPGGSNTANVTITVNPAPLTVTATGPTKTYGTALATGTFTTNFNAAGMVFSQTVTGVTLTPDAAGASVTASAGAAYVITPSAATGGGGFVATNYNITYVPYNGTVGKAAVTVTANNVNKTYGTTIANYTGSAAFTTTALQNGETIATVSIAYGAAGTTATTAAGTYTSQVTPSAATGGTFNINNYNVTYTTGSIIIDKAPLTITATGPAKPYGTALAAGSSTTNFTASGTITGQTITSVTLTPNAAGTSTATAAGAAYVVTPSAAVGSGGYNVNNYTITYVPYNGVVTQAPVILTATVNNKPYGSVLTGASGSTAFTASGLMNGQTIGSVTIAFGTGSAATAAVGTYPAQVTISAATGGTYNPANYSITYAQNNIVVTAVPLTITANNVTKTIGTAITGSTGSTAFTTTGLQNGESVGTVTVVYGTGSAAGAAIGRYNNQVTVSAATGGTFTAGNYTITYVKGAIIVIDFPPVIAYNTPNVYTVNVTIPTLAPVSTGGAVPVKSFDSGTSLTGTTFTNPQGMTFDAAGNVYVADNNGTIRIFNASGVYLNSYTGYNTPVGIVFDSSGNGYILDAGTRKIYQVNSSGTIISTITVAGLSAPFSIAIDASNNLYIADLGANRVFKVNTSGTILKTITSNINNPTGVAVDGAGNLYVTNVYQIFGFTYQSTISKYDSNGNYLSTINNSAFADEYTSLTVDSSGDVYVADDVSGTVTEYNSAGNPVATISGLTAPFGLLVDKKGSIYVSDITNNTVTKYNLIGGYYLSGPLPAGLSFNESTGQITGKPTAYFPQTSYTVIAYNSGGSGTSNTFTLECRIAFDWVGTGPWSTPANWISGVVPGPADVANIGVNVAFGAVPTVGANTTVGGILMGSTGGKAAGVSVSLGFTLTVANAITYQSDTKSFNNYTALLSGLGTITTSNLNVIASTTLSGQPYTQKLASSVTNLNVTNPIALTANMVGADAFNAAFNLTGGTGITPGFQSTNTTGSTSAFSVANATLKIGNNTFFSALSTNGSNIVTFNNAGAIIEFNGAAQTIYTDAAIAGLATGPSYYSLKLSGTGAKVPNSGNLNIAGDFTNTLTNDAVNYVNLTGTQVNFNGTTQALAGGAGKGTILNNVAFSGAGAKSMVSGTFNVISSGVLSMTGTSSTVLNAGGFLTLVSDINGSATVSALSGPSISGNVNVQRYITGGVGYRGYRLLSSPVYTSNASGNNIYSLNYPILNAYVRGSGGVAGGFDDGGNPNLYLFRENLVPSNTSFTSGNFRGVANISTPGSYLIDGESGSFHVPVGNAFMFFYRGSRKADTKLNEYSPTYVPTADTLTATGILNQGTINVAHWYTGTTNLLYTAISGDPTVQGFNLVGNPYPSSIDWDKYGTTAGSPIQVSGVGPFIYVLDSKSSNYNVYQTGNSGNFGTIAPSGSNIIPSGQGFFVVAGNASATLTFNENAKTNAQATTAQGNLFMGTPPVAAVKQYMHLILSKDSIHTDGILINFNSTAKAKYVFGEDAPYKLGNGPVSLASTSEDNIGLAINSLALPTSTQIIKLQVSAATDGVYQLALKELASVPAIYDVWLKDAYRKDSLDIKHNPIYAFDVIKSDTASFGANRFSLIIRQNPLLALHLLDFTGSKITAGIQVVWKTENEQNYTNFTVERSLDNGVTFQVIGGFSSTGAGTYSFVDKAPVTTANDEYRLKLVDLNGNVTYSGIVTIQYAPNSNNIARNGMTIFPNPATSTLNVSINQTIPNPPYEIQVVNSLGSVIKTATSKATAWQDDVSRLTPGTYIIKVINSVNKAEVGKSTFIKL